MKKKLKYLVSSFLIKKLRKQIKIYGVLEDLYNYTKDESLEAPQKFLVDWLLFNQILRYENKIERNFNYLETVIK